jgi:LmbE family N-acetylglucosaminyl deacetylase
MSDLPRTTVLAAVAHPDDIEFLFAGTLLLLQEAGCSLHMWNLADGSCGSLDRSAADTAQLRAEEAKRAAALAKAQIHPALFPDLGVFYDKPSLAAVSAKVREIHPQIILTHSPSDYMEDHQNVCRLITTAAFSRGMSNYRTNPEVAPYSEPVRIYHAPPHGLRDQLCEPFQSDYLCEIASVLDRKREMLSCHRSQFAWLEGSQGMNSPVAEMEQLCREIAGWGDGLESAEAWRRHSHLGFCAPDFDPLPELLGNYLEKPKQHR